MRYNYGSIFRKEFNEYLALRAASVRKSTLSKIKYILSELDRFLIANSITSKTLTESVLTKWLRSMDVKPITKRKKAIVVGGLAKYLSSLGFEAYIPELPREPHDYVPYIFSEEELERIIAETDNLAIRPNNPGPQAAAQMPVLIRLLYGCGLRLGEALALRWEDADLDSGLLLIKHPKNDKQRIVPISISLVEICRMYRSSGLCGSGETDFLFGNAMGSPYSQLRVREIFNTVLQKAGIKHIRGAKYERGACLHCLRHLFVLRSFSKAESEGRSFSDSVPYLSTYLGHGSIMETDKYLKFSYEMYPEAHEMVSVYTKGVFPKAVTAE